MRHSHMSNCKMLPDYNQVLSKLVNNKHQQTLVFAQIQKHPNISENYEGSRKETSELATAGLES